MLHFIVDEETLKKINSLSYQLDSIKHTICVVWVRCWHKKSDRQTHDSFQYNLSRWIINFLSPRFAVDKVQTSWGTPYFEASFNPLLVHINGSTYVCIYLCAWLDDLHATDCFQNLKITSFVVFEIFVCAKYSYFKYINIHVLWRSRVKIV